MCATTSIVLLLPMGMGAVLPGPENHGYRSSLPWLPREPVITVRATEELVGNRALPANFDWRDVNGRSFVTVDLNQHQPFYCGSCWIHGTSSALNDRIKVMREARFPDVVLARQALLNCVPAADGVSPPPGCHGGDAWMIHRFMQKQKVPDETCITYAAVNQECTPMNVCRNCFRSDNPATPFAPGPCWGEPTFIGYGVRSYGNISGEAAMMKEIYARGPIACAGVTTRDFVHSYAQNPGVLKDGVFRDSTRYNESDIDHEMEVAGWGETEDGTKYWVVRNSWGTYWGEVGWFKLERGKNSLLLEGACDWAVPDFDELDEDILHRVQGDYYLGVPGGTSLHLFAGASAPGARASPSEALSFGVVGILVGGAAVWAVLRLSPRRDAIAQRTLLG
mmetsp:Transcript_115956/g.328158  ORF Transcript_115956/g.328158 Transcript_115956/m.328158 type:complete len:393 (+) Transcript_115956:84-1262(+)